MNKMICFITAAAAFACCAASCGSRRVSTDNVSVLLEMRSNRSVEDISAEMAGDWERTSLTVNGEPSDFVPDKFTFTDNGNGTFFDTQGGLHQITWHITDSGGITITYVETDETTPAYELSDGVLTLTEDIPEGVREICITKKTKADNKENDNK
ncbi:lipocalin family protein [uncultured Ruminococcus sp.]|uniref:lipocalin family protein n=1 Tax=uncultured Ruminococcus sp. TaxID=165186 RepID=UPI00262E9851|nr:lipocalin family protein [uncultured Ruminococcus sp.]